MLDCYAKKILRVNLTTRHFTEETLSDDFIKRWIGGMGFGVRWLTQEVDAKIDALDPANKIYICVGPLTGTPAPLFAQTCIVTKSPLTTGVLNTYAGGFLSAAIKAAGYDALVIEGKADELVYLRITPKEKAIINCPELKGKSARETEEHIKAAAQRSDLHTLAIGLAGENRVRYAAGMTETRAFGRGGAGAVMGSKNLKGIGIAGINDVRVASPETFPAAVNAAYAALREALTHPWSTIGSFGRAGTCEGISELSAIHALATKHARLSSFEKAEELTGEAFIKAYPTRIVACNGCQIHCGMLRRPVKTKWGEIWTRGPEYESVYSLGTLCFNGDRDMLLKANDQSENYGMDTLSLGVCVAFAMECAERGILPRNILGDDVRLEFGNPDATIKLIDMIARREGLGDILAEGTRIAAQKIGRGSERFALNVKGMEFAAWMPQRMFGIASTFATSNRGACHKRAPIGPELAGFVPMDQMEGRAALVAEIQNNVNALFTLVGCSFANMGMPNSVFLELLKAASGIEMNETEYIRLGEAIWNLERLYNMDAGINGSEDKLPDICYEKPEDFPENIKNLTREDFALMLNEYYAVRGWDAQGRPTVERLTALGLA